MSSLSNKLPLAGFLSKSFEPLLGLTLARDSLQYIRGVLEATLAILTVAFKSRRYLTMRLCPFYAAR